MAILTTELDAINTMLSAIGEAPVNTVEDNGVVDAVLARQILKSVNIEVQSRGWHFNTEKDFVLTPTYPEGEIHLPSNVLRVDTTEEYASVDVVQRGLRLYDRRNHTYQFDAALKVDMVLFLDFSELPEPACQYITLRASRIFQERVVGSPELSQFSLKDELRALVSLNDLEAENADYNILTDNYSVYRVLDR